jgi:hypothetical protein
MLSSANTRFVMQLLQNPLLCSSANNLFDIFSEQNFVDNRGSWISGKLLFCSNNLKDNLKNSSTASKIPLEVGAVAGGGFGIGTLQRRNTEISKQIFPEKEYRGLSPNFHIHASVSDLYIPTIGLPSLLEEIDRSWDYINRSQRHECGNWG